ncbi:MAG: DUF3575 domain-containing protein [Gemmatimonadaceae bacterium]
MRVNLFSLVALAMVVPCITRAQENSGKIAVLSIQPVSSMLTIYSGEAELALSRSATLGVGATYFNPDVTDGDVTYLSSDLKLRYYADGRPFQGFSFGGSVGITRATAVDNTSGEKASASGPSIGVMVDYNWLLGAQKAFYISSGLGAKTLFISNKEVADKATLHYPTMRLSVGWAF